MVGPVRPSALLALREYPLAANVHLDPTSLPAFEALARWSMANH